MIDKFIFFLVKFSLLGDLDLSVLMTFASTVTSLVFMPAWYYSLGSLITSENETKIEIPFRALVTNLLISIIPCLIGVLIVKKYPSVKEKSIKVAKPISLFIVISLVTFSSLVKYHIYALINLKMWICVVIPWTGFLISALISVLLKFSRKQIVTISIETGIQNVAIPFLVILTSFPSPDAGIVQILLIKKFINK
jgi:predicted Na+-dependent transporter